MSMQKLSNAMKEIQPKDLAKLVEESIDDMISCTRMEQLNDIESLISRQRSYAIGMIPVTVFVFAVAILLLVLYIIEPTTPRILSSAVMFAVGVIDLLQVIRHFQDLKVKQEWVNLNREIEEGISSIMHKHGEAKD